MSRRGACHETCYSVLQSTTPYHKALLQYYSALQSTTPYYKVLLESTTPVPLFTTPVLLCTTPHQTLCSGCLPKFQPMLRLPTKVTLQHHQIMRLPQEVKLQHDQIFRTNQNQTEIFMSECSTPVTIILTAWRISRAFFGVSVASSSIAAAKPHSVVAGKSKTCCCLFVSWFLFGDCDRLSHGQNTFRPLFLQLFY